MDLSNIPMDGEKIEELQLSGLRILQKTYGFRYGMDAVLLADFVRMGHRDLVADFGTGTGILPLLLYGRGKGKSFDAFEIQEDMADMASRSMKLNGLSDVIRVHCMDVEEAHLLLGYGLMDAVFFGLFNTIAIWAVTFINNGFWITLMPFLSYAFIYCMLTYVDMLQYAPVFFLQPNQTFKTAIEAELFELLILVLLNVFFYLWYAKRERINYE